MENVDYENVNIEKKYLKKYAKKKQFPKVKNSLLELKKDFMDLKDKELKNRKENKLKEEQKNYFTT